jgi:hypothetical protein
MTVALVIIMVMVGIVSSSSGTLLVSGGVLTTAVSLPLVLGRCHLAASEIFGSSSIYFSIS